MIDNRPVGRVAVIARYTAPDGSSVGIGGPARE
jgi:hypothetical protein